MGKQNEVILTLKNDVIFKAVYGSDTEECKFVLMALLNHILGREEDPIVSLTYKNPFHMRQRVDEKESILDIKVETGSGELIDIEMQLCSYDYLANRLIYYHGGMIRESLKKGEEYGTMQKTITICIVDDILFPETKQFLNVFSLMEETTHISLSDRTGICVIELPKVNPEKKAFEELTPLERSLEYLNRADEKGSEEQDELVRLGGKELEMVQHLLKKATEEEILREKALAREKYLQDEAHFEFLRKDTMRMQRENERQQEALKREHQQLEEEQQQLKEGRHQLEEEQQALEREHQQLEEEQKQLEEEQQQLKEGHHQLKERQQALKEEQQELEEGRQALKEQQQEAERQMQEAEKLQQEARQRMEASEEKQHALNRELEKAKQELKAMKEKYAGS